MTYVHWPKQRPYLWATGAQFKDDEKRAVNRLTLFLRTSPNHWDSLDAIFLFSPIGRDAGRYNLITVESGAFVNDPAYINGELQSSDVLGDRYFDTLITDTSALKIVASNALIGIKGDDGGTGSQTVLYWGAQVNPVTVNKQLVFDSGSDFAFATPSAQIASPPGLDYNNFQRLYEFTNFSTNNFVATTGGTVSASQSSLVLPTGSAVRSNNTFYIGGINESGVNITHISLMYFGRTISGSDTTTNTVLQFYLEMNAYLRWKGQIS